jgi:hypothetical protein
LAADSSVRSQAASSVTNQAMHWKVQQSAAPSVPALARSTATLKTKTNTNLNGFKSVSLNRKAKPLRFFCFHMQRRNALPFRNIRLSRSPEGFASQLASSLPALFPVYFDERLQEAHPYLIDPYQRR